MTMVPGSVAFGALAFVFVAAVAPTLPSWLVSLTTLAFANALVVLGLIILWRAGLVPFGQALFYAIGAYAVALIDRYGGMHDVLVLIPAAAVLSAVRRLPHRFSAGALPRNLLRHAQPRHVDDSLWRAGQNRNARLDRWVSRRAANLSRLCSARRHAFVDLVLAGAGVFGRVRLAGVLYFRSVAGALAVPVRDNEIRLEFLGVSVNRLIHLKLVISGTLAGIGGAFAALSIEHVDPNMAYWTTSGGFVFVTILAGAGSVAAAFVGSFVFELLKSIAYDILPGTWQIFLGAALLVTILFLPEGLGSLFARLRQLA